MEFLISIGSICFTVRCKYSTTRNCFSEFWVDGRIPSAHISVGPGDMLREWRESLHYDGNDDSVRRVWYEPMLERLAITRSIIQQLSSRSAVIMHGAVVCDGSRAYMFTAPSGTGKSTRARLFLEKHPEGFILNGDKPIVRIENDCAMAYGSPWKGKEGWGRNTQCPLKAIFLLERSEETVITPITLSEAFDTLLQQVFIPSGEGQKANTVRLLKALEGKVRLFHLYSPATAEAVEAAYHAANEASSILHHG